MRIKVRLPKLESEQYEWPSECPQESCQGSQFKAHGVKGERKNIRDLRLKEVIVYRCKCLRCGRTFRVSQPLSILSASRTIHVSFRRRLSVRFSSPCISARALYTHRVLQYFGRHQ